MAKLLTHHDHYHVHAVFGLTALLHFIYRFSFLLIFWQESFQANAISAALLAVHFCLHVTSFQFALPRNRMKAKPMIWPEFRLHSAIFAYRNLVGTVMGIWWPDLWWRTPTVFSLVCKIAMIFITCKAADMVTERIGSKEERTTNAMPYPPGVKPCVEITAKWFYAKSQFAAAVLAVFGTPSLSFGSVLAIEIAALLMTLVRKGIIGTAGYHSIYAFSLFINFPAIVAALHGGDAAAPVAIFRALVACFVVCVLRLEMRWNKYLAWLIALVAGSALGWLVPPFYMPWLLWTGMIWSAADTVSRLKGEEQTSLLSLVRMVQAALGVKSQHG